MGNRLCVDCDKHIPKTITCLDIGSKNWGRRLYKWRTYQKWGKLENGYICPECLTKRSNAEKEREQALHREREERERKRKEEERRKMELRKREEREIAIQREMEVCERKKKEEAERRKEEAAERKR